MTKKYFIYHAQKKTVGKRFSNRIKIFIDVRAATNHTIAAFPHI